MLRNDTVLLGVVFGAPRHAPLGENDTVQLWGMCAPHSIFKT